jgi:hypothetical protein
VAGFALVLGVLVTGWRLSFLARRVDQANVRAERTWAALDAALVRRAACAVELAGSPRLDPATSLLLADAAAAALEPGLAWHQREQAESDLSHVLDAIRPWPDDPDSRLATARVRAGISRRLHNDAVASARALRSRWIVRTLRLAGHSEDPQPFEMADDRELVWPRDG